MMPKCSVFYFHMMHGRFGGKCRPNKWPGFREYQFSRIEDIYTHRSIHMLIKEYVIFIREAYFSAIFNRLITIHLSLIR